MVTKATPKYDKQKGKGSLTTERVAESLIFVHVVGCYDGKWLRFDNLAIAKQVMPIEQHHLIYIDYTDLQARFPGGTKKLWELGRKFSSKTGIELWSSLLLQAYNPLNRYEEQLGAMKENKERGINERVKRYKRKLSYLFVYDENNDAHVQTYAKIPPQACFLLDVMTAGFMDRGRRVFTEGELMELLETHRAMLHTKQSSWRIFQYYRGTLISRGFLRFAKETDK